MAARDVIDHSEQSQESSGARLVMATWPIAHSQQIGTITTGAVRGRTWDRGRFCILTLSAPKLR